MNDFHTEILRALPDATLPDIEPGRLHRFPTNGKRGDDSGWCKLFDDQRGGVFGDFRTGVNGMWQAQRETFTPAEREAFRARVAAERREREAEEARGHEEAAMIAASLWKGGQPATGDHAYLKRKGIGPHGARVSADGLLLIPMRDTAGKLWNVERIAPEKPADGSTDKKGLHRGRRTGLYCGIGDIRGAAALAICEGFATGASIHDATGLPVAVAFNAGNLTPVAEALRAKFPALALILCADDDYRTEGNPGITKAREAAEVVGGLLAVPDFGNNRPEGATDFNDLHQHAGRDTVRRQIEAAKPPAVEITGAPTVELIRGCDVKPEPIAWLWDGWLAAGKVHILGGAPGTGKTTIALALAATLTIGGRWPDGTTSQVGNVVIWSGEDDPADTLIPRLKLMGADLNRVYFVSAVHEGVEKRSFDPARDVDALRRKLDEVGDVRLLIVDPIVSAVAGDSHKNAEVRRSLQPLADLAACNRSALLGITHLSKGTSGREPVERITGSLAFGALARIVLVAAKHQSDLQNDNRLLLRAKSNIGPDDGGFEYRLQQDEAYPGILASAVLWGNAVEGAARELLTMADATGDGADGQGALDEAAEWLRGVLKDDGATDRREILASAERAGFSERTIDRARSRLGVIAKQHGYGKDKRSLWELPSIPPNMTNSAKQKSMAGLDEFGGNGKTGTIEVNV